MSCEVADAWIRECDSEATELKHLQTYREALEVNLAHISTNYLLSKKSLLNAETQEISNNAPELISYICTHYINWNDPEKIEEIGKINRVDLNATYEGLIHNWIPGSDISPSVAHSDPDATIDFTGYSTAAIRSEAVSFTDQSELVLPIMYNDPDLIRIVYLLRKCDSNVEKALILVNKFGQDVSILSGGYTTKLRIACCLIRFLSAENFLKLLHMELPTFWWAFLFYLFF